MSNFMRFLREKNLLVFPPLSSDSAQTIIELMDAPTEQRQRYDVFLGGSCGATEWRQNIVIPRLQHLGISFYNPQVELWTEELIAEEEKAKQHSVILLFVVDHMHLSVVSLIEIAYLAARQNSETTSMLLVVLPDTDRCCLGRSDSSSVFNDHKRTYAMLRRILSLHSIPVFTNVSEALQFIEWKLVGLRPVLVGLSDRRCRLVYAKMLCRKTYYHMTRSRVLGAVKFVSPTKALKLFQSDEIRKLFRPRTRTDFLKLNLMIVELMLFFTVCFCSRSLPVVLLMGGVILLHLLIQLLFPVFYSPSRSLKKSACKLKRPASYDVYLGFSGEQADLLTCLVLPQLNKNGLSYLDSSFLTDLDLRWQMLDSCSLLLFIIPSCTNFLSGLVELSYYIGLRRNVIGCVENSAMSELRAGEAGVCLQTLLDYQRGLLYLHDMAQRSNIRIFEDAHEATRIVITSIKQLPDVAFAGRSGASS